MRVIGAVLSRLSEHLLLAVYFAFRLLPNPPGQNRLSYPLTCLRPIEFVQQFSADYKTQRAGIEPSEEPLASFGTTLAKNLVGNICINNRAHLYSPKDLVVSSMKKLR